MDIVINDKKNNKENYLQNDFVIKLIKRIIYKMIKMIIYKMIKWIIYKMIEMIKMIKI